MDHSDIESKAFLGRNSQVWRSFSSDSNETSTWKRTERRRPIWVSSPRWTPFMPLKRKKKTPQRILRSVTHTSHLWLKRALFLRRKCRGIWGKLLFFHNGKRNYHKPIIFYYLPSPGGSLPEKSRFFTQFMSFFFAKEILPTNLFNWGRVFRNDK